MFAQQKMSPDVLLASPKTIPYERVQPLVDLLSTPDRKVRILALRFWADRAEDVRRALYDQAEEGVPEDQMPDLSAVPKLCDEVVSDVTKSIDSPDPTVAREALRTLCALGTQAEDVCPPIGRCGNGLQYTFEGHVWPALANVKEKHARDLRMLVDDASPTVFYNALGALADRDVSSLQPQIRPRMRSKDKLQRGVATLYFRGSSDEDTMRILAGPLADPDEDVRACAESVFHLKDPEHAFTFRAAWPPRVRAAIAEEITHSELKHHKRMLVELLNDPSGVVRAAALDGLGTGENDKEEPSLPEDRVRALLNDDYGRVRQIALNDILTRKPNDRGALLTKYLLDPDDQVRGAALWWCMHDFDSHLTDDVMKAVELGVGDYWMACGYVTAPQNGSRLEEWANSPSANIRRLVALSIRTPEGRPDYMLLLTKLVKDSDPEVLRYVVGSLSGVHDPGVAKSVQAAVSRFSGDDLVGALRVLGRSGEPLHIAFVKSFLTSADRNVAAAAKEAAKQLEKALAPP